MPDSDKITIPQLAATGKWHSKVKNPLIFQCEPLKIAVHFWPLHMGFALGPGLALIIGGTPRFFFFLNIAAHQPTKTPTKT